MVTAGPHEAIPDFNMATLSFVLRDREQQIRIWKGVLQNLGRIGVDRKNVNLFHQVMIMKAKGLVASKTLLARRSHAAGGRLP